MERNARALKRERARGLLRVQSLGFCAGLVMQGDRVCDAAPILRYMRGWSLARVCAYCARMGWSIEVLDGYKSAEDVCDAKKDPEAHR